MKIVEKRIEEKGLRKSYVAEKTDIKINTLNRWLRNENIEQMIKFIKMLDMLEIDNKEFLTEIEKEMKEK